METQVFIQGSKEVLQLLSCQQKQMWSQLASEAHWVLVLSS